MIWEMVGHIQCVFPLLLTEFVKFLKDNFFQQFQGSDFFSLGLRAGRENQHISRDSRSTTVFPSTRTDKEDEGPGPRPSFTIRSLQYNGGRP